MVERRKEIKLKEVDFKKKEGKKKWNEIKIDDRKSNDFEWIMWKKRKDNNLEKNLIEGKRWWLNEINKWKELNEIKGKIGSLKVWYLGWMEKY